MLVLHHCSTRVDLPQGGPGGGGGSPPPPPPPPTPGGGGGGGGGPAIPVVMLPAPMAGLALGHHRGGCQAQDAHRGIASAR
jgi:hypothetical protein